VEQHLSLLDRIDQLAECRLRLDSLAKRRMTIEFDYHLRQSEVSVYFNQGQSMRLEHEFPQNVDCSQAQITPRFGINIMTVIGFRNLK